MTLYTHVFASPVGDFFAAVDEGGALVRLDLVGRRDSADLARSLAAGGHAVAPDAARCAHVVRQLDEYFRGQRRQLDLEVAPRGTAFQRRVWEELRRIPYGATISYGELARRLGSPGASRAVGRANGANPIAIVIPCHRVIGADDSLTGYGGGLAVKRALLELEGALPPARAGARSGGGEQLCLW